MVSFPLSDLLALVAESWRGVGMRKVLAEQLLSLGVDPPSLELGEKVPGAPVFSVYHGSTGEAWADGNPLASKYLPGISARGGWGQEEKPEFLLYPGRKPLN